MNSSKHNSSTTGIETGLELKQIPHPRSIQMQPLDAKADTKTIEKNTKPKSTIHSLLTSPWIMWWNSEEWWSCWIGLLFFGCITAAVKHDIPSPEFLPWEKNPFYTLFGTTSNYGLLVIFAAMGLLLWLVMAAIRAPHWQKFPLGYLCVFFIALISKMLASNVALKKASLGDSIWAIIFGCCLRNLVSFISYIKTRKSANSIHDITTTTTIQLPSWLKVAQQTELYIAISLVLLCIDISVLRPLAPRALFVSWIDTPILFMVVACLGWTLLKMDPQIAIILSGATFICGSSAAIALGSSMGVPQYKTAMPIAIISIFTIPSIIALPYVAKHLNLSATVSGAWFGGCVDSTGAVIAAASIYGDVEAINTSAVVKMMQNVLIGPLSVIMAWGWSRYEIQTARRRQEEEDLLRRRDEETSDGFYLQESSSLPSTKQKYDDDHDASDKNNKKTPTKESPYVLLWKRFPKFVIGFIITAVLFNTTIKDTTTRSLVNSFCFYVAEWFSTLSFVSIGMGLELNEMKQNMRSLGKLVTLYVIAQMVDIVITCLLAWTAFTHL